MAMDDLNDIAEKWARGVTGATERYKKGVMAVKESPTQKAARAENKYRDKVAEAVANGKFRRGLQRVTLSDWQQAAVEKGAGRLASGATTGKKKMLAYLQEAKPHYDALQAKLASMPNNTLEDAKQRMLVAVEHMAAMKRG